MCATDNGGNSVKQNLIEPRTELEAKMANVFEAQIEGLSTELRQILIDDMVTAFENRIKVLNTLTANCT
jgi:hypothetical protein